MAKISAPSRHAGQQHLCIPSHDPQTEEAPQASAPCQPEASRLSPSCRLLGRTWAAEGYGRGGRRKVSATLFPEDFGRGCTCRKDRNQSCLVPTFVR